MKLLKLRKNRNEVVGAFEALEPGVDQKTKSYLYLFGQPFPWRLWFEFSILFCLEAMYWNLVLYLLKN